MNKVSMIGRLVAAPEVKTTTNDSTVTRFRIAVPRKFNRDVVDYIPIAAWRQLGELCSTYLAKGRMVAVSGELHIESYTDQTGNKRSRTEVVADDVEFLSKSEKKEEPRKEEATDIFNTNVVYDDSLPF